MGGDVLLQRVSELLCGRSRLPQDRSEGTERDLSVHRHDHDATIRVAQLLVTALLGHLGEAEALQRAHDVVAGKNRQHSATDVDVDRRDDRRRLRTARDGLVLEVQLKRFAEVRERAFEALALAGNVDLEALRHVERAFASNGSHEPHIPNVTLHVRQGKNCPDAQVAVHLRSTKKPRRKAFFRGQPQARDAAAPRPTGGP